MSQSGKSTKSNRNAGGRNDAGGRNGEARNSGQMVGYESPRTTSEHLYTRSSSINSLTINTDRGRAEVLICTICHVTCTYLRMNVCNACS